MEQICEFFVIDHTVRYWIEVGFSEQGSDKSAARYSILVRTEESWTMSALELRSVRVLKKL